MQIIKKFYKFEALGLEGTTQEIVNKLNEVNKDSNRELVFILTTPLSDGRICALIQTKTLISGFRRGE